MEIEEKKAAKKEVSEAQERKNEVENSLVMGKSSSTVELKKSRKLKTMNLDGSTAGNVSVKEKKRVGRKNLCFKY